MSYLMSQSEYTGRVKKMLLICHSPTIPLKNALEATMARYFCLVSWSCPGYLVPGSGLAFRACRSQGTLTANDKHF